MLNIKNITFIADNTEILKGINLKINKGDCISIVGPSGSGKSTLLKLCSDLISPSSGDLIYKNMNYLDCKPTELRKDISYCVQSPILFGQTVYENLAFPYNIRKVEVDKRRIIELLEAFNLNKAYLNKEIISLSGGEKQRVSIIRNLLFTPEILLLDEATSALDSENAKLVQDYIQGLNQKGVTILWITHSEEQSYSIFNKRITIAGGKVDKVEELQ